MKELTNHQALELCLQGLVQILKGRLFHLKGEKIETNPRISLEALGKVFVPHLPRNQVHIYEGLLLTLALFPYVRPQLFDRAIQDVFPDGGSFPELGGLRNQNYRGFLPSGITALYLLAGDDLARRFEIQSLLSPDHWLAKDQILIIGSPEKGTPPISGPLKLDPELVEKITLGRVSRPVFSTEFPATYVSTELKWSDLVLPESTRKQIDDILIWLVHQKAFLHDWKLSHKFKPGYRALFHGPPGTGKTFAATLLGNETGRDVYKVDLSTVVSKYIGETEKNLANLFDRAENKGWILFFDEADALFGKRTQVQNAHDRYANQEVSYLLQRVEAFNGLVILASNFKSNIDEAFLRRFQSIVHFPKPKSYERLLLWEKAIPSQITLDQDVNLKQLSQKYELTGADIMNVVQYVCLRALSDERTNLSHVGITEGIRHELVKTNKII
jgi:AAA+ superfamily predicted ATPase